MNVRRAALVAVVAFLALSTVAQDSSEGDVELPRIPDGEGDDTPQDSVDDNSQNSDVDMQGGYTTFYGDSNPGGGEDLPDGDYHYQPPGVPPPIVFTSRIVGEGFHRTWHLSFHEIPEVDDTNVREAVAGMQLRIPPKFFFDADEVYSNANITLIGCGYYTEAIVEHFIAEPEFDIEAPAFTQPTTFLTVWWSTLSLTQGCGISTLNIDLPVHLRYSNPADDNTKWTGNYDYELCLDDYVMPRLLDTKGMGNVAMLTGAVGHTVSDPCMTIPIGNIATRNFVYAVTMGLMALAAAFVSFMA